MRVVPKLSDRKLQEIAGLVGRGTSERETIRRTGVVLETVRRVKRRYEPLINEMKTLTKEHHAALWQGQLFGLQRQLFRAANKLPTLVRTEKGEQLVWDGGLSTGDIKNLTIAAAIAQEKKLLLDGQPTAITREIHELRVDLPEILARFSRVAQRVIPGEGRAVPAPEGATHAD